MPPTYSSDLKWRIIYLKNDGYSKRRISEILYVSISLINKILRLYIKWGTVENPWRKIPGRRKTFDCNDMNILRGIVQTNADLYLGEIIQEMEVQSGKHVSIPTLWRSLAYCGITRKKLHKIAKERNELLRSAFMAHIGIQYQREQLIFLDESAKDDRTISHRYGYSEINTRAIKKVVFIREKRYTFLPALSLDGIIAMDIMEGGCTKEKFKEFVISQAVCNNLTLLFLLRSNPPMIDRKLLYKFGGNFIAKNKLNRQNFANQNHHKSCCGTKSCDET
ncbi:unnamed protein product [Rhizophagus irregularis]|nr:unnamed protein product [Rhizophagus irregularis]